VIDKCVASSSHDKICQACHAQKFDFVLILTSFYQVVLGLVGLLVSCGSQVVLDRFGFLRNRFGRGFFLFFIGTLGVAQGLDALYTMVLTLVVGSINTAIGFLVMCSYACVKSGDVYTRPPTLAGNSAPLTLNNGDQRAAIADTRNDAIVPVGPQ
jgi:hypothetical protein